MSVSVKKFMRDPFVQFIIIGAIVFAVFSSISDGEYEGKTIVVSDADVARLISQWNTQYSRQPTKEQIDSIVDQYVQEEILYREARKLDLGEDDVIIRRRMVQKYQFLSEDMLEVKTPSEAKLNTFFETNKSRYTIEPKTSFYHVYFRDESGSRGDQLSSVKSNAQELKEILNNSGSNSVNNNIDWRDQGDAFMLQREYAARSDQEIAELFGRSFSSNLSILPVGEWSGPVRSAYGWHVVKIVARSTLQQQALETIRKDVLADYVADQRRLANAAFYQKTKNQYNIIYEGVNPKSELTSTVTTNTSANTSVKTTNTTDNTSGSLK